MILGDDGNIYWPISSETPAAGQNPKLLKFAGERVDAKGRVYDRGGSHSSLGIVSIQKAAGYDLISAFPSAIERQTMRGDTAFWGSAPAHAIKRKLLALHSFESQPAGSKLGIACLGSNRF